MYRQFFKLKTLTGSTSWWFIYDGDQCCGSGIRCLFDPWIRDGKKFRIRYRNKLLNEVCGYNFSTGPVPVRFRFSMRVYLRISIYLETGPDQGSKHKSDPDPC
jgi:hypothetical protein